MHPENIHNYWNILEHFRRYSYYALSLNTDKKHNQINNHKLYDLRITNITITDVSFLANSYKGFIFNSSYKEKFPFTELLL